MATVNTYTGAGKDKVGQMWAFQRTATEVNKVYRAVLPLVISESSCVSRGLLQGLLKLVLPLGVI